MSGRIKKRNPLVAVVKKMPQKVVQSKKSYTRKLKHRKKHYEDERRYSL